MTARRIRLNVSRFLARWNAQRAGLANADQPRAEGQLVFGIVQGGCYEDLREQSAREITAIDFDVTPLAGTASASDGDAANG